MKEDFILEYTITIFITQVVFIAARTWNVKAIARNRLVEVLLSGQIIHIAWLISIGIGATSTYEIINDFEWKYIPIIVASSIGGAIGNYLGLLERKKVKAKIDQNER